MGEWVVGTCSEFPTSDEAIAKRPQVPIETSAQPTFWDSPFQTGQRQFDLWAVRGGMRSIVVHLVFLYTYLLAQLSYTYCGVVSSELTGLNIKLRNA